MGKAHLTYIVTYTQRRQVLISAGTLHLLNLPTHTHSPPADPFNSPRCTHPPTHLLLNPPGHQRRMLRQQQDMEE